ncbi:hypothetical protein GCM10010191_88810 [Actinomadura vinacea]|uniref:Uncharacterized protein n=1 Tax=Actinomadura vinacea TaxID=115336 RepID=A0ABP5XH38_9ACTN
MVLGHGHRRSPWRRGCRQPVVAGYAIEEIMGEAERGLRIPRQVSERSIITALSLWTVRSPKKP